MHVGQEYLGPELHICSFQFTDQRREIGEKLKFILCKIRYPTKSSHNDDGSSSHCLVSGCLSRTQLLFY